MRKRLLSFAGLTALAVAAPMAGFAGCAQSTGTSSGFGGNGGSNNMLGNGSDNGGSGNNGSFGGSGQFGSVGVSTAADAAARPQRCTDAGGMVKCSCFNIASLGYGGGTGANFGNATGGTDNTAAFVGYLNSQSSAAVAQLGCGQDVGCGESAKPELTTDFLSQYDVLIFQWMSNGLAEVDSMGTPISQSGGKPVGFRGDGMGYWKFTDQELSNLKDWVNNGGGIITLSGYDWSSGEIGPANQVLGAVTSMQYTATDTFGTTETGNNYYCLGDSNMVTGFAPAPDLLGENITAVGAFHGRAITPGADANVKVDCTQGGSVCGAHEDVGNGHVYAYTDEWVTYTSQWNPNPQPLPDPNVCGSCSCLVDASADLFNSTSCGMTGPTCPAAQVMYQVPQFWYNAIAYASQATMCKFTLAGTIPR
jgi:hypothetical protein